MTSAMQKRSIFSLRRKQALSRLVQTNAMTEETVENSCPFSSIVQIIAHIAASGELDIVSVSTFLVQLHAIAW